MSTNLDINFKTLPKPPKTIVFGADGFIGRHFLKAYRKFYPDVIGTSNKKSSGNIHLDLLCPDISNLNLKEKGYSHALIAAGIANVARCEKEKEYTRSVNVLGVLELARQLSAAGLKVIWLSSDYVFDGHSGNYMENSPVNPVNEYGRQKREVEKHIINECKGNVLILRLSKIFGIDRGDGTLLDDIAHKFSSGRKIFAARDQVFCPTYVKDLVETLIRIQEGDFSDIINICPRPPWSRLNIAREVAWSFGLGRNLIHEISLKDLGEDFERPLKTDMATTRLNVELQRSFIPLKDCINRVVKNYLTS